MNIHSGYGMKLFYRVAGTAVQSASAAAALKVDVPEESLLDRKQKKT